MVSLVLNWQNIACPEFEPVMIQTYSSQFTCNAIFKISKHKLMHKIKKNDEKSLEHLPLHPQK